MTVTGGLLIAIIVGIAVGAVSAQILALGLAPGPVLAILSGAAGVVGAGIAQAAVMMRKSEGALPPIVILFAVVASIAGSLSGLYIAELTGGAFAWGIGALAGLFSAVLMALLVLAYRMDPTRTRRSASAR